MTIEERMDRLEERQESMIASIHGLCDVMETGNAMLGELMKWLQQPPSSGSDLPDALNALTKVIDTMTARVNALPAEVARALR